jgi:hypothetical protein
MAGSGFLSGLFSSAFSYRDKKGKVWWLHEKDSASGTKLYYFSSTAENSIGLPSDRIVIESTRTGMPLLKKAGTGTG